MLKALKEALSAIFKPVTLTYPAGKPEEKYSQIPEGLRGGITSSMKINSEKPR